MTLQQYLESQGLSVPDFAEMAGVSGPAVYRYLAGSRIPHRTVMQRISTISQGAVLPNDFYTGQSRAPQP